MKNFYTKSTVIFHTLYGESYEKRSEHRLFWGLLSWNTKKIITNPFN